MRYAEHAVLQAAAAMGPGSTEEGSMQSMDGEVLRRLKADITMELNVLRNAAYSSGFVAAKQTIAGTILREFA
jgi:hypothetical protein